MTAEESRDRYERFLPALSTKVEEFRFYGYRSVTEEDLWLYCISKLWRKKDFSSMPSHETVAEILSISPAKYMTHTQVESYKKVTDSGSFYGLDEEEFRELLAPKGTEKADKVTWGH